MIKTKALTIFVSKSLFYILIKFSVIMSSLWENSNYREQIINIGSNDPEFIRFVNMLINDTTFLLDEAISSLKEIFFQLVPSTESMITN